MVVPAATQEEAKEEEQEAPEAVTVDQPIIKPVLTAVSCDLSDASLNNLLGVEEGYKPYVPTIPAMDEMDLALLGLAA